MEWRGGMVPHIGADETVKAKNQTIINNSTSLSECTSKWNQYGGPNRDGHSVQGVPVNWKKYQILCGKFLRVLDTHQF